MTDLQTISPERAAELVRRGAALIDIREADEHVREHIPGARHHALSRIDAESPVRAGDEVLVFHCRSGARTQGHAARLSAAANCEAYILDGGLDAWKKAGLPVAFDRSQPIDIIRQVQIAAGSSGTDGHIARDIPGARLLCALGLCRRWIDVRRHHRLLWNGAPAGADALESPNRARGSMMSARSACDCIRKRGRFCPWSCRRRRFDLGRTAAGLCRRCALPAYRDRHKRDCRRPQRRCQSRRPRTCRNSEMAVRNYICNCRHDRRGRWRAAW